jgi:hypothetical protein
MVHIHQEGSRPTTHLLVVAATRGGAACGAPAVAQGGCQVIASIAAGAIEQGKVLVGSSLLEAGPRRHLGPAQQQLGQGRPVGAQGIASQVGVVCSSHSTQKAEGSGQLPCLNMCESLHARLAKACQPESSHCWESVICPIEHTPQQWVCHKAQQVDADGKRVWEHVGLAYTYTCQVHLQDQPLHTIAGP